MGKKSRILRRRNRKPGKRPLHGSKINDSKSRIGRVNTKKAKAGKTENNLYAFRAPGNVLGEWLLQHRSLLVVAGMILLLGAGLGTGFHYILTHYEVTTIYVDGNTHHTNEEIMELVMSGRLGNNSLFLSLKYKDRSIEGIPFIEKMDVSILARDTIRINVYEKALAGYVEFLGNFLYFDNDGIVVESSRQTTAGIPQITGLDFSYAVLYEKLPVENEDIFAKILDITQLLEVYNINADKLFFNENEEITLYFENVRVALGGSEHIDEKVMELQNILPSLEGKSGILRMENYDEYSNQTVFETDL